jgi:hypothetical protein
MAVSGWGAAPTAYLVNIKAGRLERKSVMKFLAEWIADGENVSAEERATLCDLKIMVGGENACFHWDSRAEAWHELVRVPSVHLAEGIARDWWGIFGGRDVAYRMMRYRMGFILPCLTLSCDGSTLEVSGEQMECENPGLRFWSAGNEVVPRHEAEAELGSFVDGVVGQLGSRDVRGSDLELCWGRVLESRLDAEESAFCEAAGALGVDPYSIEECDARFIEAAGEVFQEGSLSDFLSGVRLLGRSHRSQVLDGIGHAQRKEGDSALLPDLYDATRGVDAGARVRRPGERAWAAGYRSARAFRRIMGVGQGDDLSSVDAISRRLGANGFAHAEGLTGVSALVCRGDGVRIHLRGGGRDVDWSDNFNFARSIGDAVCFPDGECSVVNGLHGAERQAMGRAFAAEFLAPVERVVDMVHEGLDSFDIAGQLRVSPYVVERQVENRGRIREACGQG